MFATSPSPAGEAGVWEEIARLCRRVCVLEERGETGAAGEIRRGTLAAQVAKARDETPGADGAIESRLHSVFQVERDRVANAAVLADLLVPQLREVLAASAPALPAAAAAPREVPTAPDVPPPRREPTDIAGFIDQMIALEHGRSEPALRQSA